MKLTKILFEYVCPKCGYQITKNRKFSNDRIVCPNCYTKDALRKNKSDLDQIVVTRHTALVEWLKLHKFVSDNVQVIAYAKPEDLKNKHVFGKLPYRMACHAAQYTEVVIRTPEEKKGKELTLKELEFYIVDSNTYMIIDVGSL